MGWDDARKIVFETDPRHAAIIVDQLKLEDAKIVSIPGTKEERKTTNDCDQ